METNRHGNDSNDRDGSNDRDANSGHTHSALDFEFTFDVSEVAGGVIEPEVREPL
ncbi:hypothetical protein JDV02_008042 [Purpureocillium takamizusanense]|uniref:Uncharacterized protein n=1 Tax=Purpureocillium takamizusanense TaxID=2060973 RepID=A0A9Q8QMV1_9HYPO|nr:uncharacterized protein JDV02_008042 [Purpureocillium takamizusanense]UNI22122.1 hypothetical protein JDV02_008042 [Purpureocillium takamizusanense]